MKIPIYVHQCQLWRTLVLGSRSIRATGASRGAAVLVPSWLRSGRCLGRQSDAASTGHWSDPGPELGLGRQGQWFQSCQGYNRVLINSTIWLFSRWTLKCKRVFGRWWTRFFGSCPLLYMLHVTCHKSDLCWIPIQHNNINSVLHERAFKWLLTFLKAAIYLFV